MGFETFPINGVCRNGTVFLSRWKWFLVLSSKWEDDGTCQSNVLLQQHLAAVSGRRFRPPLVLVMLQSLGWMRWSFEGLKYHWLIHKLSKIHSQPRLSLTTCYQ